jgi:hypothetical protein
VGALGQLDGDSGGDMNMPPPLEDRRLSACVLRLERRRSVEDRQRLSAPALLVARYEAPVSGMRPQESALGARKDEKGAWARDGQGQGLELSVYQSVHI